MAAAVTQMRAAVFTEYSTPASQYIQLSTLPMPTAAKPTDVVIKVVAAALNPVDFKIVHGDLKSLLSLDLPSKLGFDVSGVVSAVGGGVQRFKVGDEVYARVDHDKQGTVAEYCVTSEDSLALKPKSLSFDEAAGVPLAGLTALQSLRDVGKLGAGQRVLILGGSGGVGTFAIQLSAKILQASEVIVTAGTHSNDLVKSLGATQVVDYKYEDYKEKVSEVDLVFDTTGDANNAFKVVKKGGMVVSITSAPLSDGLRRAGLEIDTATSAFLTAGAAPTLANAALHSATYEFVWMHPDGSELTEFAEWLDSGRVKSVVDRVFPFDQVKQAFDYIEDGHAKGKIIIHVQEP